MCAGIVISCSENESLTTLQALELKFPSSSESSARTSEKFETYKVMIKSTLPLVIISNDLTIVKAINSETGELSSVVVQTENGNLKELAGSRIAKAEPSIKRGYMYDGNDCFVWGTIVTASNGEVFFYAADTTTQLLMNRCGYSNVA